MYICTTFLRLTTELRETYRNCLRHLIKGNFIRLTLKLKLQQQKKKFSCQINKEGERGGWKIVPKIGKDWIETEDEITIRWKNWKIFANWCIHCRKVRLRRLCVTFASYLDSRFNRCCFCCAQTRTKEKLQFSCSDNKFQLQMVSAFKRIAACAWCVAFEG